MRREGGRAREEQSTSLKSNSTKTHCRDQASGLGREPRVHQTHCVQASGSGRGLQLAPATAESRTEGERTIPTSRCRQLVRGGQTQGASWLSFAARCIVVACIASCTKQSLLPTENSKPIENATENLIENPNKSSEKRAASRFHSSCVFFSNHPDLRRLLSSPCATNTNCGLRAPKRTEQANGHQGRPANEPTRFAFLGIDSIFFAPLRWPLQQKA